MVRPEANIARLQKRERGAFAGWRLSEGRREGFHNHLHRGLQLDGDVIHSSFTSPVGRESAQPGSFVSGDTSMNTMISNPFQTQRSGTAGLKVDISRGERIGRVSSEWFSPPDDERYLSLTDLHCAVSDRTDCARVRTVETADIRVEATRDNAQSLSLIVPGGREALAPTHWSYGQLCSLVGAPVSYMRQLPAPLAASSSRQWGQRLDVSKYFNHCARITGEFAVTELEISAGSTPLRIAHSTRFGGRYLLSSRHLAKTETSIVSLTLA